MDVFWLWLIIAVFLGFIPATIASNKGHSFGMWWFYGFLIFIVAFPHALCLKDEIKEQNELRDKKQQEKLKKEEVQTKLQLNAPKLLLEYKELLDKGIISKSEFIKKKNEILNGDILGIENTNKSNNSSEYLIEKENTHEWNVKLKSGKKLKLYFPDGYNSMDVYAKLDEMGYSENEIAQCI